MIMLRPEGTLDLDYLITILEAKQITCMESVPSLLQSLFTLIEEHHRRSATKHLRSLVAGGTYSFVIFVSYRTVLSTVCR